jgi:SAM-dependent methyltransferase
MAHIEQLEFFKTCFDYFPEIFQNEIAHVLDIGSLDINGGPHLLLSSSYIGTDIGKGPNVDLVCPSQELSFETNKFDATISSECWEHNPFWRESIGQMCRMTKPGGVVIWSSAGIGRAVHGTSTSKDQGVSAPFVAISSDYYRNLDVRSARRAINYEGWFSDYVFLENFKSNDIYFFGLRHGASYEKTVNSKQLITTLIDAYGNVNTFAIRRFLYNIGLSKFVELGFDLRRFSTVVLTADAKMKRARKKVKFWLNIK